MVKTSNAWNFADKNFQSLELFEQKFPRVGTFQAKTSNAWNFSSKNFQCRLAPIAIGAGEPRPDVYRGGFGSSLVKASPPAHKARGPGPASRRPGSICDRDFACWERLAVHSGPPKSAGLAPTKMGLAPRTAGCSSRCCIGTTDAHVTCAPTLCALESAPIFIGARLLVWGPVQA